MKTRQRRQIRYAPNGKGCHVCESHSSNEQGYPVVKRNGKTRFLHHLVYAERNGEIPKGMVVRHTCDNPKCINPDHLILGTHADNVADRVARGRSAKGEQNGRAKLTVGKVKEILKSTESFVALARTYGVDRKTIHLIKQRKIWVWVDVN